MNAPKAAFAIADPTHLDLVRQGTRAWNRWRQEFGSIRADLSNADLTGISLPGADFAQADLAGATLNGTTLTGAHFSGANLTAATFVAAKLNGSYFIEADLRDADFSEAQLSGACLNDAKLIGTKLVGAKLVGAHLDRAYVRDANLSWVDLSDARLQHACFVKSNLDNSILRGCHVFGISAWDLSLEGATQSNLIITPDNESCVQLDSLEVAQFVYLLLNNKKIRHVVDAITSKLVLILGRFTPARQTVLEAIRAELRRRDYLPVLFDFEKPTNRDITETVSTLAHMARFVIADLTDAKSIPQELSRIVPFLPSVPVQPILLASAREWGMYETFPRYPWVLPIAFYEDQGALLSDLALKVIDPAEQKAMEQTNYLSGK